MDQFYTQKHVSLDIIRKLIDKGLINKKTILVEPSAGQGSFLKAYHNVLGEKRPYIAFDIEPMNNDFHIKKCDFLSLEPKYSRKNVVIGNPPFGTRSKLAVDFINKSFEWSDIVCFILPMQFNRFLTQKKVIPEAKLVYSGELPSDIYIYKKKQYKVNTIFQVWTKNSFQGGLGKDLRKTKQDPISHKDFATRIHNNTQLTREKYFKKKDFSWDFAVHRQGFYDYSQIIRKTEDLIANRQYLFVKYEKDVARKIFKKVNFTELSKKNTQIPGYSTTDVVGEYTRIKG